MPLHPSHRAGTALALAALLAAGCKTIPPAVAEQRSRTEEGGSIIIHPGSALPNAAHQVLNVIDVHCAGRHEITAIAPLDAGPVPVPGDPSWIHTFTQATYEVARTRGVVVSYACRDPANRTLNQMLREFASADHLEEMCTGPADCGALTCGASRKWPGNLACTFSDGPPPLRGAGAPCTADTQCQAGLRCKGLQDFSRCE